MMYVKLKAIAVGQGGVEQEIELRLHVSHLEERSNGKLYGEVSSEYSVIGRFDFAPSPGFNAWGSSESVVATKLPWSKVFPCDKHYGFIGKIAAAAREAGFDNFEWNDRLYSVVPRSDPPMWDDKGLIADLVEVKAKCVECGWPAQGPTSNWHAYGCKLTPL